MYRLTESQWKFLKKYEQVLKGSPLDNSLRESVYELHDDRLATFTLIMAEEHGMPAWHRHRASIQEGGEFIREGIRMAIVGKASELKQLLAMHTQENGTYEPTPCAIKDTVHTHTVDYGSDANEVIVHQWPLPHYQKTLPSGLPRSFAWIAIVLALIGFAIGFLFP